MTPITDPSHNFIAGPADPPTPGADPESKESGRIDSGIGSWNRPLSTDDLPGPAPVGPDDPELLRVGAGRYELLGEIARGGMGVILRGYDRDLNRELAVKLLRPEQAGRPASERRFVEEAQVAGQLQHPGVIPVHDLGRLPDGRPYFVMKLVNGRTLSELLAARADPSAEHGRLVQVFLQVCHTIAYAHSRGVLHRDLKPSNVMVGSFGEVLVMDWGLAKVLRRDGRPGAAPAVAGPAAPPSNEVPAVIRTAGPELGPETATGSVLGTPGFMSPEQAGGDVDWLDERVDVFGLGAILCVILTGKPPYAVEPGGRVSLETIWEQLAEAFSRLDASGADLELIGLCKRCLAVDRDMRPRHAGEVAAAVGAHLAGVDGRARQAELDRVRVEGELRAARVNAREEEIRRRAQTAIAVTIALLLALGAVLVAWQDHEAADRKALERVRVARNAEAARALLEQAEAALRDDNTGRAAVAFEQAERRVAEGGAEHLKKWLARCRAEVEVLRDLDRIDALQWSVVNGRRQGPGEAAAAWPPAFARLGIVPGDTAPDVAARRVNGSPARERLLTALDRWHAAAPSADLLAILRAADPDAFRNETREAHLAGRPERIRALAETAAALEQPAWFAVALGVQDAIPAARRKQILAAGLGHRPGNVVLFMIRDELESQDDL